MSRSIPLTVLFVVAVVWLACTAADPKQPVKDYQKLADETDWTFADFNFKETLATEFKGYDVKSEPVPDSKRDLVVHISKEKKELLAWETHNTTPFFQRNGILYYAKFSSASNGCAVVAFDLNQKKELWRTSLKGIGRVNHFGYSNSVRLEVFDDDTLRVFGKESLGRYVEIVNRGTGKTVGHKVFKDEKK